MKIHLVIRYILLFSLSVMLSSCAFNPATGTPDIVMMSESREIEIGTEMFEKIKKSMPLYEDEKILAYVNEIGQKVAKAGDRPDLEYQFIIIDSPDINAFALPGGFIMINRGLLAYLNSEAQLAAVLAHEVGHVTARHAVRQDAAKTGAGVLSVLSVLTTGSWAIGDMASLWSTAAVKGYGREMELEADGFGAEYLYRTGYDPQAMVEAIGVLKDQEKFSRYRAKEEGKKQRSYHGVFATHPRNDIRLKEIVAKAGTYDNSNKDVMKEHSFRQKMEGLVYGRNYQTIAKQQKPREENRYIHGKLGFTMVFPDEWKVENKRSAIVGEPNDKSANIKLEIAILKQPVPPGDFIRQRLNAKLLAQSEGFSQFGLLGHKGIIPGENGQPDKRVAVLYQGRKVYLITGEATAPKKGVNYDEMFLASIHSFQPAVPKRAIPKSKAIHYVKANDNTTFSGLAKQMRIGRYAEQQLRLINGYYPRGEPLPGEWIKIVR